jgi:hypothetical protein
VAAATDPDTSFKKQKLLFFAFLYYPHFSTIYFYKTGFPIFSPSNKNNPLGCVAELVWQLLNFCFRGIYAVFFELSAFDKFSLFGENEGAVSAFGFQLGT